MQYKLRGLDQRRRGGVAVESLKDQEIRDVRLRLQAVMRSLRARSGGVVQPLVTSDVRAGYLDGRTVSRLVLTLRSAGCAWAGSAGGCVMCGHWSGTLKGELPDAAELTRAVLEELNRRDLSLTPVVCLYGAGSVLNPRETPAEVLDIVAVRLASSPVRRLIVESRPEYATRERLSELRRKLGGVALTVAMGLECADETLRLAGLNKGLSNADIHRAAEEIRSVADLKLYVFAGAPFLTEREVIDEALAGLRLARVLGAAEVDPQAKVHVKWLYSWYDPAGRVDPERLSEIIMAIFTKGVGGVSTNSIGRVERPCNVFV